MWWICTYREAKAEFRLQAFATVACHDVVFPTPPRPFDGSNLPSFMTRMPRLPQPSLLGYQRLDFAVIGLRWVCPDMQNIENGDDMWWPIHKWRFSSRLQLIPSFKCGFLTSKTGNGLGLEPTEERLEATPGHQVASFLALSSWDPSKCCGPEKETSRRPRLMFQHGQS